MKYMIGIRREDKNKWERRVPLTPEHVRELIQNHSVEVWLQPSPIRIFSDEEYIQAGAKIQEDLSQCPIVFGVKEMPLVFFQPHNTYVFFSHVIKGQDYNMPMLKRMLELKCQLIDYEKVVDEEKRRLIFFGKHAGIAGMIDTLWALGQRLCWEKIPNPFERIKNAYKYKNLAEAKEEISDVGKKIKREGLDKSLLPFICGISGYGHVSQGVQEILDLLPIKEISPDEIFPLIEGAEYSQNHIYKVVFKEEHTVEPIFSADRFELQDYYDHPEKYRSKFETYIPHLTLFMNCIYWDKRYPKLVTKKYLKQLYAGKEKPRLRVIGDISCDIEGSVECDLKWTQPDNPVYVYNPFEDKAIDGYEGNGPVVLAVDNLPCEISKEASIYFSQVLKPFIPEIVKADFSVDFDQCNLPLPIKNAVIVYHGELTSNYRYLKNYL
ncbi:MAG: bifunctional lysine ketoglutarate reductase /saccharopine dehydrogenase family protein [candidate division Zixibacteria bacterium]|nr:bifunctional lysine ketoglutarate reductase /saccharopine dehydrogenase family protein [candidate division Zixibacteria bacterium]